MTDASWQCPLPDEGRVGELAGVIRQHLLAPLVIWLRGELGAGKTTFARALIHALGYSGRVKSPTYGILETYNAGGLNVLHLDLYRIEVPAELDQIAIRDLFDEHSLLLAEWPEKGGTRLPAADLDLQFGETAGQRWVRLTPASGAGERLSQAVQPEVKRRFLD